MRRLSVISLLLLTLGLIAFLCEAPFTTRTVTVVETVEVIKVVETVEVIKEVEVVKEVPAPMTVEENHPKETIIFHDGGWDSIMILNAIAMHITQHGYGYPVEQISASGDAMEVYLPLGDEHVSMELWRFGRQEWYDKNLAAGRIIDVGAVFESSEQGLYVPRYMIDGDAKRGIEAVAPDLKSVTDLPEYWELFKDPADPGKGILVTCPVDWTCHKMIQIKAAAYGLDEHFNKLVPNTGDELEAAIIQAYERGNPVLSYYWEPNWLLGKYDLVRLEEPAYTDECWVEIVKAVDQEPVGTVAQACAFPTHDIHKGVYGGLLNRAPEVVVFLKNMFIGTERIDELAAYMKNNELTPEEVAIHYLQNYENEWRGWVPADVAEKVKASLP